MANLTLKFECPTTKLAVLIVVPQSREGTKQYWEKDLRRICPHCGQRHRFAFKDGLLAGALSVDD
jgi:hypothetical protein